MIQGVKVSIPLFPVTAALPTEDTTCILLHHQKGQVEHTFGYGRQYFQHQHWRKIHPCE
jgi:hypothetical protein